MKLKKLSCGVLGAMMVLSCNSAFALENDVVVNLDGEKLNFDVNPIIESGRTMVPFRKIFEELGCSVSYQNDAEGMIVSAWHGSDLIRLRIGDYNIAINGENKALEVAPEIVDSRTLVPLRAVSEALDCNVKWNKDTRTVDITSKIGQYKVKTENIVKVVKNDAGKMLLSIDCAYPVIVSEEENAFYTYINNEYKKNAEEYVKSIEEWTEDANSIYEGLGEDFRPLVFSLSYEVTLNRNNMLSITTHNYENTNGAHPNTSKESRTFQMILEKELSLTDILDCDQEDVDKVVMNSFEETLTNEPYNMDLAEFKKSLTEEVQNVSFYLTDDSLVMYFNPYQVGPYAIGAPSSEIKYTGAEGIVKIDLSGANLERFEFGLSGNDSTGYSWGIVESDAEIVDVKSEYTPDENKDGLVGKGGTYKFVVTGVNKGSCTVKCSYMRGWDAETPALKTIAYDLYVNEDKTITFINERELNEGTITLINNND